MEEVEMLGHVAELNELPYVSAFIEALVDAPCVCVCLGREVQEQEISCSSKLKFMDTGPYCHPSLFLLPEKHSGSVMSAAGVDIKQDCNANTQRGSVRGALGGEVVFITGRRQTDRVQRDGTDVEDSAGRDWSDLKGNKTRGRGGERGHSVHSCWGGKNAPKPETPSCHSSYGS